MGHFIQVAAIVVPLIIQLAMAAAVWMWKRAQDANAMQYRIDGKTSIATELEELKTTTTKLTREITDMHVKASDYNDSLQKRISEMETSFKMSLNAVMFGDLRDYGNQIAQIREGQTEWHRTLRRRTHELANFMNSIVLRISLMERGVRPEVPIRTFEFSTHDGTVEDL